MFDPVGLVKGDADAMTETLDVRGLLPPEPLMETLARVAELQGDSLLTIYDRYPSLLFPELDARGFGYVVDTRPDGVYVHISRRPLAANGPLRYD
jgi:tRNA 2-thiouridine synthesizing protein A